MCLQYNSFKNTVGKSVKCNFSFSRSVFYPSEEPTTIFINSEIVACKPYQFGRVSHLSFGKGLNTNHHYFIYISQLTYPCTELQSLGTGQIQSICRRQINIVDMIFVFYSLEKIVEEGENDGYQHFLLFPNWVYKTTMGFQDFGKGSF